MADDKKTTIAGLVDAGPSELQNKKDEPAFKLGLTTKQILFKCGDDHRPVSVCIKIFNPTNELMTFKVRCTSAEIFRVQPPLGHLKAQTACPIVIWYQNQGKAELQSKNHYFAFYHTKGDARTPKEVWLTAKPDGVRRIPAKFEAAKCESTSK